MEKDLKELVTRLRQAAGTNLKSVVLYGSAVTGEFHPKHSDLNVLSVLDRLDVAALEQLNPAAAWWARKGHPAPLAFTAEELHRAADVFAIELLDIKASRRVLFGEDLFAALEVPTRLHHLQVERELRTNLVRLRQSYLATPRNDKALLRLMTASLPSFTTLFRHALIALGDPAPHATARQWPAPESSQDAPAGSAGAGARSRSAIDRLAALFGFDPGGFHTVLEVREAKRSPGSVDARATFHKYLEAVARVTQAVDEKLGEANP
jgi:predicted nucleotidyltransferase